MQDKLHHFAYSQESPCLRIDIVFSYLMYSASNVMLPDIIINTVCVVSNVHSLEKRLRLQQKHDA
jgi:hypothetical protein